MRSPPRQSQVLADKGKELVNGVSANERDERGDRGAE
jgi:hypothetical protein